jgi:mRNA interferase RelE/StbE
MKALFRESFWRDVSKVKDAKIRARINEAIAAVEAAGSIAEIKNVSKMDGASNAFRIRIGKFRIGFYLEGGTVEFVRCLDRKEIYRYFP